MRRFQQSERSIPCTHRHFLREAKEFPMTRLTIFLTAAAAGGLAAPLAAQYPYPQPYPPQYPQQTYPQPYPGQPGYGYGYQQGYGNQGAIGQIIDQLLGNRYNVTDRQAISRCASAAMVQAQNQYRGGYSQGYGAYGQAYGQGYAPPYGGYGANIRVTAITNVERRSNGLRVSGLLDSGMYRGQAYGQPYGGYANGDLTFRCNVDYRGYVSNVRIRRNESYRRY